MKSTVEFRGKKVIVTTGDMKTVFTSANNQSAAEQIAILQYLLIQSQEVSRIARSEYDQLREKNERLREATVSLLEWIDNNADFHEFVYEWTGKHS